MAEVDPKIAVVTGASSGVGLAVTRALLNDGYVVHAQHRSGATFTAENLHWWKADFPDLGTVPAVDRLDALVHCAGVCRLGKVAATDISDWQQALDVNLLAPVSLTNLLLPALRAAGGHIIYVNSGAGLRANPNWGTYAASKFAAKAWCDALRAEEPSLRVTSIHPGRIDTPMQEAIVASEGGDYDGSKFLQVETVAASISNVLALPGDAQPTSIELRPRG
ncbi:SDR family oxidoreductase [Staphylococcus chromogenes]|nr:SDR family oxidoreductase [Staphylococcus chromogenes]